MVPNSNPPATRRQRRLVITGKHCTHVSTSGSIRRLLVLAYTTEVNGYNYIETKVSACMIHEGP